MKFVDRYGNLHENKEKEISHSYLDYDNPFREKLEAFYAKMRKAPKEERFLQSPISRNFIRLFVNRHEIDLRDYEGYPFLSFDEFYRRKIKKGKRPIAFEENILIAPCDGKAMLTKIGDMGTFSYKNKIYSLGNQIGNYRPGQKFAHGTALIIHLSPEDYHHFISFDEGEKSANRTIKGGQLASDIRNQEEFYLYKKDYRENFMFRSKHFGDCALIFSSGTYKGSLSCIQEQKDLKKGEELGFFESGNAYVLVFFEKNKVIFDQDLERNSKNNLLTQIKMGERIGSSFY